MAIAASASRRASLYGAIFAVSSTTLVFFNYLYFLKWFPVLDSRVWVVAIIGLSSIPALLTSREVFLAAKSAVPLVLFAAVATASFFWFRTSEFRPTYLYGLLLSSLPFFCLGALAACAPRGVSMVVFLAGISIAAAVAIALLYSGSLYEDGYFRNILAIPQTEGRVSYRAYYQLVSYGLALGSIPLLVRLVSDGRYLAGHLTLALVMLLIMLTGSRGPFMVLPAAYCILVWKRADLIEAIKVALFAALFAFVAANTPIVSQAPLFARSAAVDEFSGYKESTIAPETALEQDVATDTNTQQAQPAELDQPREQPLYWGRGTLYSFALKGWLESPQAFIFGHGLGSFSLGITGIYPDWVLSPAAGSIYPHNAVLEICYELGLIGLVPFAFAVAWPLRRFALSQWQASSSDRATLIILFLLVVGMSMVSGGIASNYTLYFFMGAAAVATTKGNMGVLTRMSEAP